MTTDRPALPLIVVGGDSSCAMDDLLDEARADLAAAGWHVDEGWPAGRHPLRPAVAVGVVEDGDDLRHPTLAAVSGWGVVVEARCSRAVVEQLCDDLRRLGRLQLRSPESGWPAMPAEDRRLLDLLSAGASLDRAAEELGVSRRTADRRLALARDRLGVRSTSEAVAARRRRRSLVPPAPPDESGRP